MKKRIIIISLTVIIMIVCTMFYNFVNANESTSNDTNIQNTTGSKIVELKEKELSSIEDYEETYGSKSYGLTAYILHKVQIYSIPLCFLGIVIGAIYDYVLGVRHLETKEKGLALMVTFVTLAVICQVLPLVFTIVVKFGRE